MSEVARTAQQRTETEQLKLLHSSVRQSFLVSVLNAALLAYIQWDVIAHSTVLIWLTVLISSNLARLSMTVMFYQQDITRLNAAKWLNLFVLSTLAVGLAWGSSAVWLFPVDDVPHQAFVAFVVAGMGAGAVATLSPHVRSIQVFLFPLIVPLIVQLFLLGTELAIVMGVMVTLFMGMLLSVSRRINKTLIDNIRLTEDATIREQSLRNSQKLLSESSLLARKNAETLEQLHAITSETDVSSSDKIRAVMELGRSTFGLPIAIVSHIEQQQYTVEYVITPDNSLQPGTRFELGSTYCVHTLSADGPLGFNHVAKSAINSHPCYLTFHLEAYLGVPLIVAGARYGTLNFSSPEPRDEVFTDDDFRLMRLLAQWIANEIWREKVETALKESESGLRQVLDSVYDGIVIFGMDGKVLDINNRMLEMFSLNYEQALDMSYADFITNDPFNRVGQNYWQAAIAGDDVLFEWQLRREAVGEVLDLEVFLQDISWRYQSVIMANVRNISERKRIERMKSEFISTVSHELRTPLTSIRGSLSLLESGRVDSNSEQYKTMLDIASRNSDRLNLLINDLLDMEKISSGKMDIHLEPTLLAPQLEKALREMESYATQFQVDYRLNNDCARAVVSIDVQRFQQVMLNLLSNAAKFSSPNSNVDVNVDCVENRVTVSVRDFGAGIDDEFKGRIFEKFSQADSSDARQKGGTGLGLAISRSLIEKMNGSIGYESKKGEGARFFIELPAVEP